MNDTVNDVLYAGGGDWFNTDTASYWPLYRYDGTHWDTLGLFGNELKTAVMYHDTLIVGGAFKSILDEPIKRIACFAGGTWQSYGDINSGIEGAYVQSLRVIDGEMYATGPFTHADGYYCNGLAKRVGGHWENVGPVPEYVGTPIMKDIAKYQGKLVVSGIFDFADNSIRNLMQLVDTAWEPPAPTACPAAGTSPRPPARPTRSSTTTRCTSPQASATASCATWAMTSATSAAH
ncbi:MAG: hypothetical protein IPI05_05205 [Flavobacteriales bacterium]|nr:hypothetical protein [Flavobacteriales bacterium]